MAGGRAGRAPEAASGSASSADPSRGCPEELGAPARRPPGSGVLGSSGSAAAGEGLGGGAGNGTWVPREGEEPGRRLSQCPASLPGSPVCPAAALAGKVKSPAFPSPALVNSHGASRQKGGAIHHPAYVGNLLGLRGGQQCLLEGDSVPVFYLWWDWHPPTCAFQA